MLIWVIFSPLISIFFVLATDRQSEYLQQTLATLSLILHKMLTFTGTLNLSRFRENWDVVATNEFHRV